MSVVLDGAINSEVPEAAASWRGSRRHVGAWLALQGRDSVHQIFQELLLHQNYMNQLLDSNGDPGFTPPRV